MKKEKVLDIGSRVELFVDDWLIDRIKNLNLKLHSPVPKEIAIRFDAPWEGKCSAYVTVMKDGNRYRMYYRGGPAFRQGEGKEFTCYAESKDGVNWTKPPLGMYEFNGSKDNNIVWAGFGTHNFAPFKDANPSALESEKYKAVAGGPLFALSSPDGIHWKKMQEEPIITKGVFDSLNTAFWNKEKNMYVAFVRDFRGGLPNGVRDIRHCTSKDFLRWAEPEWLDYGDAPAEHLYTNAIIPYFRAPHIYLGLPKRFAPERKAIKTHNYDGVSDAVFMSSRDGVHWHRFMEAFIRPGLDQENWTDRNIMPAWGIVPTDKNEISIYYSEHFDHPDSRLRRSIMRPDGFVSINADYTGGKFATKPLTFKGKNLIINYSTSAAGSICIEIQDENGKVISGYSLNECPRIYGDEIEHIVTWNKGSDVSSLAGKPIRLKFAMKDADLYSICFKP